VQTTNSISARCLFLVPLLACACAPEPIYDDELGLQAVSVDDGALAGTFVGKTSVTRRADLPVIGVQDTGGDTFWLITRTATDEGYDEVIAPCGGRTFPTPGGQSTMPHESYQLADVIGAPTITFDHDLGSYEMAGHLELWGIRDLPDPATSPLPTGDAEAGVEPHRSRIWDPDDDGHPGLTSRIEGVANGDVYFVQRRQFDWAGLVLSEDRLLGLVQSRPENRVIGASSDLLNTQFVDGPHPDPKEAWFEQVRIADGADCDDVLEAADAEVVSRIRPF